MLLQERGNEAAGLSGSCQLPPVHAKSSLISLLADGYEQVLPGRANPPALARSGVLAGPRLATHRLTLVGSVLVKHFVEAVEHDAVLQAEVVELAAL